MSAPSKRRRSPEFMAAVANLRDFGATFLEAVREADATAERCGLRRYAHEAPTPVQSDKMLEKMRLENQLATWNATVPPGTRVAYRTHVGAPERETKTRSAAWALGDHCTVLLEGVSGGYDLDFIRVLSETP